MREILKGKMNDRIISKTLLCVLSFFMILFFAPIDVQAAGPTMLMVNGTNIITAVDNTVKCGEGTAVYDSVNNTLTLTNATMNQKYADTYVIYSSGSDSNLNIKLVGTNTIKTDGYGIYTSSTKLTIIGDGNLSIESNHTCITAYNDININGALLNLISSEEDGIHNEDGTTSLNDGANVIINSLSAGIASSDGISISNSMIDVETVGTAFYDPDYYHFNALYSWSGDVFIAGSTVNVQTTAKDAYPAIWAQNVNITDNSNVTVKTTGSNAIYSPNTLSITNSSLTAESPDFPIWCNGSITISGSTIKSADTGGNSTDPAIHTGNTLAITNGSDVIADGGITAVNGMTVTPVNGSLVEFKAGIHENGEQGATHRGNSPYSEAFSFKNEDIELGYTYIHIKDHIHTGNTANCTDKAICTDCGKTYGDIDPNNHKNLTKIDAKSATHLEDGNIEYYYCDGCGKYFRDKDGTEEISLDDTVVSKITEHTVDNTGWHSDENSHWNTCECGEILNQTSHTFKWVVDKEATATEKGSKHEECEICGYKKASVEIPVTGTNTDDEQKPSDTDKTDNGTNSGNTTNTSNNDKNSTTSADSPKTGDTTNLGLYTSLFAMSGLLVAILAVLRKKKAFGHK